MIRTVLSASVAAVVLAGCATDAGPFPSIAAPVQAQDSYFLKAHAAVDARAAERGSQRAKNVILFIGDGMGVATITAARIYSGQAKGVDGESYRLAMEQLPYSAFSKTYTHDSQVADSAPTAVAMTTGIKSYNGSIGVTQATDMRDCTSAAGHGVTDAVGDGRGCRPCNRRRVHGAHHPRNACRDLRARQPSATGRPTPTSVRRQGNAGCPDIATQFVAWDKSNGDGFEVILGGGRQKFLPSTATDPEYADQQRRSRGRPQPD